DSAIVVVENIYVHVAAGESAIQSVHEAMGDIAAPLVGSTITPVVVFLPLAGADDGRCAAGLARAGAVFYARPGAALREAIAAGRAAGRRGGAGWIHSAVSHRGLRAAPHPGAEAPKNRARGDRCPAGDLLSDLQTSGERVPSPLRRGSIRTRLHSAARRLAGGDRPHAPARRGIAEENAGRGELLAPDRPATRPGHYRAEHGRLSGQTQIRTPPPDGRGGGGTAAQDRHQRAGAAGRIRRDPQRSD